MWSRICRFTTTWSTRVDLFVVLCQQSPRLQALHDNVPSSNDPAESLDSEISCSSSTDFMMNILSVFVSVGYLLNHIRNAHSVRVLCEVQDELRFQVLQRLLNSQEWRMCVVRSSEIVGVEAKYVGHAG